MSNPNATPTTLAYRHHVAACAATGGTLSKAAWMCFGSGSQPYSPDEDVGLVDEFARVPVVCTVSGSVLTVRGTLTGVVAGNHVLREFSVETDTGVLMGRRVVKPKEFEPTSEIELDLDFEY
ncbi:hypothetical protein OH710_06480 [Pseudomonas capsici]|uniref:hypothetical protein n=1 Tax=Pseudomonas capsici TaxID=2810614 RepID=UPI0021F1499D|nr:hypothetical protein [Pseudomonas capsici]MCV4272284.1 hypothetical protein [Pseudomonas capsici]